MYGGRAGGASEAVIRGPYGWVIAPDGRGQLLGGSTQHPGQAGTMNGEKGRFMGVLVKPSSGTEFAKGKPSIATMVEAERRRMKGSLATVLAAGLVLAHLTAVAQSTNGPSGSDPQGDQNQQRDQDRLQTSSPELDQKRTRLHECLPGTVQEAVQDMKKAREQYEQQLQEKKKVLTASTDQDRERLRDQLRATIQDQLRDREQLRERLQALRESLPSHQQLMEQAREQIQQHDRRGD